MSSAPPTDPNRHFESREDAARFVAAFETCALPCARWNHRAHLVVGLWYVRAYPPAQATHALRAGIQRYNRACGWPTTATTGYHETLTRFWVWALGRYLAEPESRADPQLPGLLNRLLNSAYADKSFPFQYYSRERLMGWEARVCWQPPDLRPLEPAAP